MRALQQQLADLASDDPDLALEAGRAGRWTWLQARAAFGDRQLGEALERILRGAVEARRAREDGEAPRGGVATNLASEILSYCPAEPVPPKYSDLIERDVLAPDRLQPVYFFDAVVAMHVLRTPDGLDERRRLWCEETCQTTPSAATNCHLRSR